MGNLGSIDTSQKLNAKAHGVHINVKHRDDVNAVHFEATDPSLWKLNEGILEMSKQGKGKQDLTVTVPSKHRGSLSINHRGSGSVKIDSWSGNALEVRTECVGTYIGEADVSVLTIHGSGDNLVHLGQVRAETASIVSAGGIEIGTLKSQEKVNIDCAGNLRIVTLMAPPPRLKVRGMCMILG